MLFGVHTAVALTLIVCDFVNFLKKPLTVASVSLAWLVVWAWGWVGIFDDNLWLVFYVADVTVVIASAIASPYLGFTGFFVITFMAGFLFTAVWVMQFTRFVNERQSALLELGPLSKYPGVDVGIVVHIDYVSYSFALLTALISLCVYAYAFSYMRFEKNILNFLIYFKLFG